MLVSQELVFYLQRVIRSLELAFATKKLREICESDVSASLHLNHGIIKAFKARLADLRAVDTIFDLPASTPEFIIYCDLECVGINLPNNEQMIVSANHSNNPLQDDGYIDWLRINRIKIMCIGATS